MSKEVWQTILEAIPDIERWNANIPELKRLTEKYGEEFRLFVKAEAQRRGYHWSSSLKKYVHPWTLKPCNHPGRLIGVGYRSGQLACFFASKDGPVRYESVSTEIPEETAEKLVKNPYPDALYAKLIKNKGIQMVRVG